MKKELIFLMMVGLPGSGKSTAVKDNSKTFSPCVVLNSDAYIEAVAEHLGVTYNDCFHDYIKEAELNLQRELEDAIAEKKHIFWDQTNLTRSSRARKLAKIPDTYLKYAAYVQTPSRKEWDRRLSSRPGKVISQTVLANMANSLQIPTKEEGFDQIFMLTTE